MAPERRSLTSDAAAPSTARSPAGGSATGGQRNVGFDGEPHVGQVNGHPAYGLQQFLVDAEREPVHIERFVVFGRLIQSQCKTRTASAAASKIDADGLTRLALKVAFQLLTGVFTQFNHKSSTKTKGSCTSKATRPQALKTYTADNEVCSTLCQPRFQAKAYRSKIPLLFTKSGLAFPAETS